MAEELCECSQSALQTETLRLLLYGALQSQGLLRSTSRLSGPRLSPSEKWGC